MMRIIWQLMYLRKPTNLGEPGKNYFCCQTSKDSQGLLHYLPKQSIDSSHAALSKIPARLLPRFAHFQSLAATAKIRCRLRLHQTLAARAAVLSGRRIPGADNGQKRCFEVVTNPEIPPCLIYACCY
jgi:hypothetical protein